MWQPVALRVARLSACAKGGGPPSVGRQECLPHLSGENQTYERKPLSLHHRTNITALCPIAEGTRMRQVVPVPLFPPCFALMTWSTSQPKTVFVFVYQAALAQGIGTG